MFMAGVRRISRASGGLAMAFASLLTCGTAFAQTAADGTDSSAKGSFKLLRVIVSLPVGAPWLALKHGAFCAFGPTIQTWTAGRAAQKLGSYSPAFKTELEKAGYKVITPGEDNLFDPEAGSTDYEAAAEIVDEHIDGCRDNNDSVASQGYVKGDSAMKIDWQIYSPIKKLVVARIRTDASAKLDKLTPSGVERLVAESFAANVRELAANKDFLAAVSAPKALTNGFVMPGQQNTIVLSGSLKAQRQKISDAVGSVVTILTGNGSGSGFLVSDDG